MDIDPDILNARANAYDLSAATPAPTELPEPTAEQLAAAALHSVHELAMKLGVPTQALADEGMVGGSPGSMLHGLQQTQAALIQIQHYMQSSDARFNALLQAVCRLSPGSTARIMQDVSKAGRAAANTMQFEQTLAAAKRAEKAKKRREAGK